jgi:hypothetical protein
MAVKPSEEDWQAALAVNEFDTEMIADAIAHAREAAFEAGRREGLEVAIKVIEDYEGETNMQTGDFIHPNDLLPYHWADKIRALLPAITDTDEGATP